MTELLYCPFCGSTDIDPKGCASIAPGVRDRIDFWKDAKPEDIIERPSCNNCGATTDGNWNTRTAPPTPTTDEIRLHCGEIMPDEMRTIMAVLKWYRARNTIKAECVDVDKLAEETVEKIRRNRENIIGGYDNTVHPFEIIKTALLKAQGRG